MNKEKHQLKIIDMDLLGRGIGKCDGKAVFVQGAVTGDTVIYETETSKKRYDIGRLIEVVNPSENRIVSKCRHFGQCGGCTFLGVKREVELKIKLQAVENAFRRAGIKVKPEKILSGTGTEYRNKVVFHLAEDSKYGFFTSSSHNCTHVKECILVPPVFNKIIDYTEQYFLEQNIENAPKDIMLRHGNDGIMLVVSTEKLGEYYDYLDSVCENFQMISSTYECIGYPTSFDTTFIHYSKNKTITTDFCGVTLGISPASFFQVNEEVAAMLCKEIADFLSPDKGSTILDLYCGIGTIGLSVAKMFPDINIIGIEINESAVEDAKENCKSSGITNAGFFCCDAGKTDLSNIFPDAIIVDPPRFGLTDSMISSLVKSDVTKIIYMSCNPSTLAGDSLKLISEGYSITRCSAADMFPGCPHVETVALFEKGVAQ